MYAINCILLYWQAHILSFAQESPHDYPLHSISHGNHFIQCSRIKQGLSQCSNLYAMYVWIAELVCHLKSKSEEWI